ncbi:VanZ family protein [Paenibacillus cymbidii]|uniref:VanZ family protein n=1 Tax=Paenibacillus cymbidii TaxID=1639034 RepID=UPI001080C797|nr:VanZ family protein [Paenibacillus cymbidii]
MKATAQATAGKKTFVWLPAVLVMSVIFLLSAMSYQQQSLAKPLAGAIHRTQAGGLLSGVTIRYGSLTIDGAKDGPADVLEFFVRKGAHVAEYMLLAAFVLLAIRHTTRLGFRSSAALALVIAVAFAVTDEFHQLFAKDRGARPLDVLLDSGGACLGIAVYALIAKRRRQAAGSAEQRPAPPSVEGP